MFGSKIDEIEYRTRSEMQLYTHNMSLNDFFKEDIDTSLVGSCTDVD